MRFESPLIPLLLALAISGCGARSGLRVPIEPDATDVMDAAIDVREIVIPPDVPLDDGLRCASDSDCDDRIACTIDRCDRTTARCSHAPDDTVCDDHVFCNGSEQCSPTSGCVRTPRSCADAIDCTRDRCDETTRQCTHAPDDSLCPISHRCDPMLGCLARALAADPNALYEVLLPSGTVNLLTNTDVSLADLALHPDRTLYGVTGSRGGNEIVSLDIMTGRSTRIGSAPEALVALDVAPDGTLYGAARSVWRIDPARGTSTVVATFPAPLTASGDIAFLAGRMLATVSTSGTTMGPNDALMLVDPVAGTTTMLGFTGYSCVWGLAALGTTLYGLTCEGRVLHIDATTGAATEIGRNSRVQFWGASAR